MPALTLTNDQIVQFESRNSGMNVAIERARTTLPAFFKAPSHWTAIQSGFCLKERFVSGGENEHIWVADLDTSKSLMEGTIRNEPKLPSLTYMQRVSFKMSDVTDWMYMENGYLVGGYTTKVIRSRLST